MRSNPCLMTSFPAQFDSVRVDRAAVVPTHQYVIDSDVNDMPRQRVSRRICQYLRVCFGMPHFDSQPKLVRCSKDKTAQTHSISECMVWYKGGGNRLPASRDRWIAGFGCQRQID